MSVRDRPISSNRVQAELARGGVVVGAFLRYPDAGLAELLALSGLDFVVFDGEHGSLSPHQCEHLVRAVELHDVTPLVRVDENRPATILRYLDAGAMGCHVPAVETAAAATAAVRAVKFRPRGDRGLAASRASGFGPADGYPAFIERSNRLTQVIVQVESAKGVAAADEIATVDGVDVLLLGALDLSHDIGVSGELDHPELTLAAEKVARAAVAAGKAFGVVVSDSDTARLWVAKGARYLIFPVEAFIRPSIRRHVQQLRRDPSEGTRSA